MLCVSELRFFKELKMFGIGFFEICIIALFALIFVGPQKLPELMSQMGKLFVYFRRFSSEAKDTFDSVLIEAEEDIKKEQQNHSIPSSLNKNKKQRTSVESKPHRSYESTT